MFGAGLGAGLLFILAAGILAVTVTGTVTSFASGETVSAAKINENFASLKAAIEGIPDCTENSASLKMSANANVTNNTLNVLSWDVEEFDSQNMHAAADPTRVTISTAGRYLVIGHLSYAANSSGNRQIRILKNGVLWTVNNVQAPGFAAIFDLTAVMDLAAGDYLEIGAVQNSGGTLQVEASENRFQVVRLCGN